MRFSKHDTIRARTTSGLTFENSSAVAIGSVSNAAVWQIGYSTIAANSRHDVWGRTMRFNTNNNENAQVTLNCMANSSGTFNKTCYVSGTIRTAEDSGTSTAVLTFIASKADDYLGTNAAVVTTRPLFHWQKGDGTVFGICDAVGAWSFGPSTPGNIYHTFFGNISIGAAAGDKGIGQNCFYDASRNWNRTSNSSSGVAISFAPNTSGTAMNIYLNVPGDTGSTQARTAATLSTEGAFVFGPPNGVSTTGHKVQAGTSTNTATFTIECNKLTTARAMLVLSPATGSDGSDIKWAGTGGLYFKKTDNTEVGQIDNNGQFFFSPSTTTGSPFKVATSTQNNRVTLIGRDSSATTISLANSGSITFRVADSSNSAAMFFVFDGTNGASALVHVGFGNSTTVVNQFGGKFVAGAPGASQVGISFANTNSEVTLTAGSSGASTLRIIVISPQC